jgi:hypothetical protein
MTFDSWTSLTGDPFLSVTAHYIDSPADKPQEWELKMEQLAFKPIQGNHSGANVGSILIKVIGDYGIREKVWTVLLPFSCLHLTLLNCRLAGSQPTMQPTTTQLFKLSPRPLTLLV